MVYCQVATVLVFSVEKVKIFFSFDSKLFLVALIDTSYRDIRNLVIGRIYNPAMLGFITKVRNFRILLLQTLMGPYRPLCCRSVSSHQDNRARVKDKVRRSIITSSFLIFPIMVGLTVVAEPLVKIILTENGCRSAFFTDLLYILCILAHKYRKSAGDLCFGTK